MLVCCNMKDFENVQVIPLMPGEPVTFPGCPGRTSVPHPGMAAYKIQTATILGSVCTV